MPRSPLLAGFALAVLTLFPTAAHGNTPEELILEAVEALETSNVHVDDEADLSRRDEVEAALEGSSIALVVLPDNVAFEDVSKRSSSDSVYYAGDIYDKVQDDYRTVIVVTNDEIEVDSNQSTVSIEDLLANADSTNPAPILLEMETIEDWNEFRTEEWVPWAGLFSLIILLPVAIVVINSLRNRFNYHRAAKAARKWVEEGKRQREAKELELNRELNELKQAEEKRYRDSVLTEISPAVPHGVALVLDELQDWTLTDVAPHDLDFAKEIREVVELFSLLFARLDEMGSPQQLRVTQVAVDDMLDKITSVLSRSYYSNIVKHPNLWTDPDERIRLIKRALAGLRVELVNNIRNVNASQDLNFQVAVRSLTRLKDGPSPEDLMGPA